MAEACSVCGEQAPAAELSTCNACGASFHLNPRNDQNGKDCGAVWINDQYLALEFACRACLDGEPPPQASPAPRVLKPKTGPRRYRKRA